MSEIIIPVSYDKQEAIPKTDIQNDLTATTSGKVLDASQGKILKDAVDKSEVLILTKSGINTLSTTIENSAIETDMVCIKAELSNPSAQTSDWTVNTDVAGRATISGSISGSTDIVIYLMKSR